MAQVSANQYDFDNESGFLASMDNGRDAGNEIQTGVPAEMASVEVGEPGKGVFSEYYVLAFGGFPDSQLKTGSARVFGDIQDDANADVPAGTQMRLVITNKQRDNVIDRTRWYDVGSEVESTDVENRPVLEFSGLNNAKWAKEGRVIAVQVRNQRTTFTVDSSGNSSLQFPLVGGK